MSLYVLHIQETILQSKNLKNKLKDELGIKNVKHGVVGPVIGTHAGPGACLITYVTKK